MKQILDELPYGPGPEFRIAANTQLRASLVEAVDLYAKSREEALAILYKNKELSKARPVEVEADYEEVAASCGHFSFSLQYFANETRFYLDTLDDLKLEIDERPGGRTWSWLKLWRRMQGSGNLKPGGDAGKYLPYFRCMVFSHPELTLLQSKRLPPIVVKIIIFSLMWQAQARERFPRLSF